jgi:NitT/TauT family transport system substrate-binding protein
VAAFTNNHAAGPLYWPQFAPEGLEVEVTTLTSGTDMNRALEADDLDFAIFGIVNGFIESEQGLGSKIVAMGARQGAGLIVSRTSEIADVAGLAGRRIALKGPAFQLLVLYTLLDEAGLDPASDVEIVPVEYNDQPTALERGDVDAFMGSEPNASRSVASGAGRRLVNIYTTPVGELNSTIWASPRMVADEPDLVRAAVAMQRDAANNLTPSGSNDPEVWRDLVVDQFGLEEDVYRELITNCGAVWELSEFWVDQAKAAGAKMAELGLLQAEPDYDDLIRTEFMPA